MAQTMKIRQGDVVHVIRGKDRGKEGRVIASMPKEGRVLVENVNLVKRHQRPRPIQNASRKVRYESEIRPQLKDELGLDSVMQVPRLQKITLNMGVGEAKTDAKLLDYAVEELTTIAGQRAQVRRARKSIAQLKVREGMPVGEI